MVTSQFDKTLTIFSGNKKSYFLGFLLSIILTIVPFWVTIYNLTNKLISLELILISATIQILVHLIFFFHLNTLRCNKENEYLISFILTLIIIFILMIGSIWIMHNLNNNMIIH